MSKDEADVSGLSKKKLSVLADVSGDLCGLFEKELGVLANWETKFQAKYPVVGHLTEADVSGLSEKELGVLADVFGDLSGLSEKELDVLADWETKFQAKYPVVGRLIDA